jgi:hypothetical protein
MQGEGIFSVIVFDKEDRTKVVFPESLKLYKFDACQL